jgi:hypothetical protein
MAVEAIPSQGDPLPAEVAALSIPGPVVLVWLRHVG